MAMNVPKVPPLWSMTFPMVPNISRPLSPMRQALKPPKSTPPAMPTLIPNMKPIFTRDQHEGLWDWP